jgi:hypothetical protein
LALAEGPSESYVRVGWSAAGVVIRQVGPREANMVKQTSLGVAAVLFAGALGAQDARPPMSVFVTGAQVEARKDVDEATKNALKAKREEAKEARKAKEKELKDQLGKKRETWPPEKDDELYALEEAEALARAEYEYRKLDPKAIGDSVKDIVNAVNGKGTSGRKKGVALVSAAADADLVLQVLARRGEKTLPTQFKPDWCYVFFSIGPGGKLDAARFAKVPKEYRIRKGFGWGIYKISGPSADYPVFRFESNNLMTSGAWGSFGCYGSAANAAAAALEKFIEDNHGVLTSP